MARQTRSVVERDSGRLAHAVLRLSIGASTSGAVGLIVGGLAGSWLLTYLIGGAQHVVPHWYYLPILFAALRFGPIAAIVVAVVSGVLAGPLTYLDVATGTPQETARWLGRAGFFVVIGLSMSELVRPSIPTIAGELRRLRDERSLRQALERGEFLLRYQPVIDLRSGQLAGVEALARWHHPEQGELGPGAFLPSAEQSAVIHELGAFVLRRACEDAARWAELAGSVGRPPPFVSVNMSARELGSPVLIERVRDTLVTTGVDPSQICIEITESVLVDDLDVSVARLAGLKTLGIRLAVDDFGTGYSSLSSVHRFPIDTLKVDRSFIAPIGHDPEIEPLLAGLELFARSMNLTTVAEGIERPDQARIVADLGYDLAQGFHFARPILPEEIEALVLDGPVWQMAPDASTPGDRQVVRRPSRGQPPA